MAEQIPIESISSELTPEQIEVHKDLEVFQKVNYLLGNEDIVQTVQPAAKLRLFNILRTKEISDEELTQELRKIQRLSKKEERLSDPHNPLATIGIEVEIPEEDVTDLHKYYLSLLSIPNEYQHVDPTYSQYDSLWEVNPDFSYSAEVQSRILMELVHMGLIRVDEKGKVLSYPPLSLHLNFVPPTGIYFDDIPREEVELLNDIFTYGFTSTERIRLRKSDHAFNVTVNTVHESSKSHPSDNEDQWMVRIELKSQGFSNSSAYRLLHESQLLMTIFFAHVKYTHKQKLSFLEAHLADLWKEFEEEAIQHLNQEGMNPNDVTKVQHKVINKLHTSNLREESRTLLTKYAQKANQILAVEHFDEEVTEPIE